MWCLLLELVGVVDLEDSRISTELPQGSPAKTHDAFHAVEVVLYFGTLTYEPAKCLMLADDTRLRRRNAESRANGENGDHKCEKNAQEVQTDSQPSLRAFMKKRLAVPIYFQRNGTNLIGNCQPVCTDSCERGRKRQRLNANIPVFNINTLAILT